MDQSMSMDHNYGVPFIPSHYIRETTAKWCTMFLLGMCMLCKLYFHFMSEDVSTETNAYFLFVGVFAV